MSSIKITIELPEDLVERVQTGQSTLDAGYVMNLVESELVRMRAAKFLRDAAKKLRTLADEDKPTPEEISEIVHEVRAEMAAKK